LVERSDGHRRDRSFDISKIGVYILLCNNRRYYVSSTNDLDRRLEEHQNGYVNSTKNILPLKLAFFQNCHNLVEGRKLEYSIKQKKNKIIIEKIIKDGFIKFTGL